MDSHCDCRSARPSARTQINLDELLADLISGDDACAEAAMQALAALGSEALPALREIAASPAPGQRWWAISTLAQIEAVDVDWLIAALDDNAIEVQQSAVLGLTKHPHPKVASALLDLLPSPNSILRNLTMNALIALGKDAIPALLTFIDEHKEKDSARISAIRALASIADTRAIPALMAASEEDSALIQHWAEEGLENLGLDMVYMKLD